jgi:hypothetical protein
VSSSAGRTAIRNWRDMRFSSARPPHPGRRFTGDMPRGGSAFHGAAKNPPAHPVRRARA